jgi:pantoate--beta-alanine ligase
VSVATKFRHPRGAGSLSITKNVAECRAWLKKARAKGQSVGFVPTMGALHRGHVSLMEQSAGENDVTVASIFVNPTQFGPAEDLSRYPRPFEADVAMCKKAGVAMVYAPAPDVMYPPGYATYVDVERLTDTLCGAKRPGHFRGVATVVTKLFNIVRPDRAYFGQKDAQQVRVIQQMVRDLDMEVEVRVCPIVREEDGLALSSRNVYLSKEQRAIAQVVPRSLEAVKRAFAAGERSAHALRHGATAVINAEPHAFLDYAEIVSAITLRPLDRIDEDALVAVAVRIGSTRLIDNALLKLKPGSASGAPSPRKAPSARTSRPSPRAPASKGRSAARRS